MSEWAAKQGLPRKVTLYEKHNLQVRHDTIWFSPETEESSAKFAVMNLRVRSFVSRNNSPIPFHIVEEVATASVLGVLDTQREECGKGKVKVVILEKSMDIHGGKIKRYNLCRYIHLQQSEGIVHAVEVKIKEKYLKNILYFLCLHKERYQRNAQGFSFLRNRKTLTSYAWLFSFIITSLRLC